MTSFVATMTRWWGDYDYGDHGKKTEIFDFSVCLTNHHKRTNEATEISKICTFRQTFFLFNCRFRFSHFTIFYVKTASGRRGLISIWLNKHQVWCMISESRYKIGYLALDPVIWHIGVGFRLWIIFLKPEVTSKFAVEHCYF